MKALLVVVLALALPGPAFAAARQDVHPSKAPILIPIGDLLTHPSAYVEKTISTRGRVDDVYSAHVFTLDENQLFDSGRSAIVVVPQADAIAVQRAEVSVIGVVRLFERSTMARQFDLSGLADDLLG